MFQSEKFFGLDASIYSDRINLIFYSRIPFCFHVTDNYDLLYFGLLFCFQGIKALMGVDFLGVLLGWKIFDHAAHLGGALFGM